MDDREVLFFKAMGGPPTLRLRTGGMSLDSLRDPSLLRLEGGEDGELSHRQIEESSAEDRLLYSNGLLEANSGALITLLSPPLRFLTGSSRL